MAPECGCGHDTPMVLDVREMTPRVRHPKIFEAFDALAPGEAFVLVNDHDPKPLFYQFEFERKGTFHWRYLEEGPDVWRVEIGKAGGAIGPEQTVGDVVHHHAGALEVMKALIRPVASACGRSAAWMVTG